jgi:hypothetical protein
MNIIKQKILLGEEVDILEIFFGALSTPKNNLTKDLLSDGLDNEGELGYNEYKWQQMKGNE